jgi:hypothetical protein
MIGMANLLVSVAAFYSKAKQYHPAIVIGFAP